MEPLSAIHFWSPVCAVIALALLSQGRCEAGVPYGIGEWPETWGNHRARIRVVEKADAIRVRIPWRRRDPAPGEKDVLILDASTGRQIKNLARVEIQREFGEIVFQPLTIPGYYEAYYMPYKVTGWEYMPTVTYPSPQPGADISWLERHGLTQEQLTEGKWRNLPEAQVLEIQARSEFHRFDPMEVIATVDETRELLSRHPKSSCLLFPEDRLHPIRMTDDLPLCWIEKGPGMSFSGEAMRGEFYVFQIGVVAARKAIENIEVQFGGLRSDAGKTIPAAAFRCFNLSGTDWLGRPIKKTFAVGEGKVRPLWIGVQIPEEAAPGSYRGSLTVKPAGEEATEIALSLSVSGPSLEDRGDSDLGRLSRLRWLDSTIGLDDETEHPYTPLKVQGKTVSCLGRQVRFSGTGLPESIRSSVGTGSRSGREILARPMALVVETEEGEIDWKGGRTKILKSSPGLVVRQADSTGAGLSLSCKAKMEADGYINFRLTLKAGKAMEVKDIRLEISLRREVATYMMGMGCKGGYRQKEWRWAWDENRANNSLWIGETDAGLHCKLKGPEDAWELYNLKASGIPESWGNRGRGGCTVTEEGGEVAVRAYSGPRTLRPEEEIEFRFGLLITPVKPLDPAHWSQRYYHAYVPVDTAAAAGATVINIHHGNELNRYINYPFLAVEKLSAYVRQAHEKGIKVKIYYTVRELSNRVAEMWALRSLGHEIYMDGSGGGDSWLQEHLVSGYAPAWRQPLPGGEADAAIATTGLSRWHNYYLEGIAWLLRNVGIDGLYLDGIGYDREIMKRVRKVLERTRPGSLIDFHSGNNFEPQYGLSNCANQYMEHFPYIDSLWFGEGFNYDESPDYWLVEVSGIPFGLFGEMLQNNGNPWRGMIYGMTARYYSGADPKHIWKVWDEFGIQDARMIGYWDPSCPVRTDHKDILATAYIRKGKTLLSIASWAKAPARCRLKIDWKALGLNPTEAKLFAPAIAGFQEEARFSPTDAVPVEPGKGWLLILGTGS